MQSNKKIAVDAMGGDGGPSVIIPSVEKFLLKHNDVEAKIFGDSKIIEKYYNGLNTLVKTRTKIVHTPEYISSNDSPSSVIRSKKNSSMRLAIESVKNSECNACVSAGNTGALMALSRLVLGTLDGIDRPAIETMMPSLFGHTHVLDLGANVDCKAENLYQFGVMGSVVCSILDDINNPSVGLLNVGQEAIKGNQQVKAADELLKASKLNYIGYVEGDDIFCSEINVVVCDGFIGNIALKTSEGVAKYMSQQLKNEYTKNFMTKLAGVSSTKVLNSFKKIIDPRRYNGASLLGLNGVVIKSHGGADEVAFESSLDIAIKEADLSIPTCINKKLNEILN